MVIKFGLAVLQVNLALFASMLVVLLYLDNLFINKLRTKSNSVLNRMVSNTG